jgi:DHA2 family multidrug resistance protein-like MFS transporter
MPNYTCRPGASISLALFCWRRDGDLTLALDGKKWGFPRCCWRAGGHRRGLDCALFVARRGNERAVQPEPVSQPHLLPRLGGSFAGRIGSGMLPFMTPVFLQIGLGFRRFTPG